MVVSENSATTIPLCWDYF